ncbi:MAG: mechanosensitive ion channel family protein [Actinomycetota bacterium]|nr:mechanosensitive ion channel family protein [Actinomycetota bacterium]
MLAQAVDVVTTCGEDPSFICREVLARTENESLAELADVLFAKPLTIAIVILVALAVNWVARRSIGRLVRVMLGDTEPTRRLKRRLRTTRVGAVLPSAVLDTGVLSIRAAARATTLGNVLRSVATFIIWTLAGITILGELGVNLGPLIAGAGLAGVALGFGAQSLVKDFLAGIFILVEDQYGVGDVIDAGEASGTVEDVTLRQTRLRDVQGTVWHIPNGQIVRVGNMSQQWARALLDVDVAHGTDTDEAQRILKEVADGLWRDRTFAGQILEEPEVWGIEAIGPDAVSLRLVIKTQPAKQWGVMRELRRRIKQAFDEVGIEIPFQQRTIWVRREDGAPELPGTEELDGAPAAPAKKAPAKRSSTAKKAAKPS